MRKISIGIISTLSYLGIRQGTIKSLDRYNILHAVDVTDDDVTELSIHSADTDVLVLAIWRYPEMCPDTSFVTGSGAIRRTIKLKPIVEALGPAKTALLPAFHP